MSDSLARLGVCAVFLVLMAPLYLMFRFLVRLARAAYGFDPGGEDEGPPLRICPACHNTVMEADFRDCPYCGRPLPPAPAEPA
jgi:hypothetical protein